MSKIILVTKGTYGDVVPFIAIGVALKQRAHRVKLLTQSHYKPLAELSGLEFDSWDSEEQYRAFVADGALLDDVRGIKLFAERHLFPTVVSETKVIEKHCDTSDAVLVIKSMGCMPAFFVGEQRHIRTVSVFIAAAQLQCFDLLLEYYRTVLADKINEIRSSLSLSRISNWTQWAMTPDLFVGCWPISFALVPTAFAKKFVCTGFLRNDTCESGDLTPEVVSALRDSCVLITGGTANWKLATRFYEVAVQACSIERLRGILVCRHDQILPRPLPQSILQVDYLPFATLMPRVVAVIHHGGTSVLVRALAAAVPQLMLPFGADRPDTARRVELLGVGRRILPLDWHAEKIAAALSQIITSPVVREACLKARELLSDSVEELRQTCIAIEAVANSS
jgi:UDP:flavonoid glycosyltransferase YjiC (YdhE family)